MLCARSKFDGNKKQYCTLLVLHRKQTHTRFVLFDLTRESPQHEKQNSSAVGDFAI